MLNSFSGRPHVVRGIMIQSKDAQTLAVLEQGFAVVNAKGTFENVGEGALPEEYASLPVVDFGQKIIMPGLIDGHVHLPQYSFTGVGHGTLLEWLERFAFPTEQLFSNSDYARTAARIFFQDLKRSGTTLACVYVTVHTQATDIAFEEAEKAGVRVIMGKVLMDRNAPDTLKEDWKKSVVDTEQLIGKWHGRDNGRLQYAITPRFALTCVADAMKAYGELARKHGTFIQTHLSENKEEVAKVRFAFPGQIDYAAVYEKNGLMNPKSIFAHCIHLQSSEEKRIREAGAVVAHCPSSNRALQSGVFPFRQRQNAQLKICLGSDIGAGYSLSMFQEMKECIETSKTWGLVQSDSHDAPLNLEQAFFAATTGAANALGFGAQFGRIEAGLEADYIVIDDSCLNPFEKTKNFQSPRERLSRIIYSGVSGAHTPGFVKHVCVRGKDVLVS